ncbi:MAG: phosphotransferase [candidate division Zixibacteria bacterium]|nr:phosphotransferase [candidate division Zixibacteria bacterium]
MSNSPELLLKRVQCILPDLEIEQFDINEEGLINDVVIINHKYVFRFAKTEQGAADLIREECILKLIRPTIDVNIPTPKYHDKDYMVYPFIEGEPLLLDRIRRWDEITQGRMAESLGSFLFNLHTTNISQTKPELHATLAPVTRERWLKIYGGIKETVYPLLWKHQVRWAEGVFDCMLENESFFEYKPALIHGDLRPYHILTDNEDSSLNGVIDFGVAGIGDPASDFGTLINTYGESFVVKMMNTYPNLEELMPRARFYAQALELQWAWLGLEFKENFWFIAHLGCARDIDS